MIVRYAVFSLNLNSVFHCLLRTGLLPEAGSPGGRPKILISQLLLALQDSIATQFVVELVE